MAGRGAWRFRRGALHHEGGGGGVGDGGGALCWALLPLGLGWLGPNVIEDILGGSGLRCRRGAGLGLGLGLAAGCGPGAPTGLAGCSAVVLGFGWAAGAGLVGALALAVAGLLAVGTGLGAGLGGSPRGLGGGVVDEDVVVVMNEVVVVVGVVESETEERAVGDGGRPWAAGASVGCWVLRVVRRRVRVRAPGVCGRLPWRPVLAGAGVGACGGVVALSRLCGHVGYPGGFHICSRTRGCVSWR